MGHVLAEDRALLQWQFGGASGLTCPKILVAHVDGRLVGIQGLIETGFNLHGTVLKAAWLANLYTLPDVRALGVGVSLLTAPLRMGYDVLASVGLSDEVFQILPMLRYQTLKAIPRCVGVVNSDSCTRIGGKNLPAAVTVGSQKGFTSENWDDTISEAWDELWSKTLSLRMVCSNKNHEYLNWRYLNHPRFKYEVVALSKRHLLVGLVIYRREKLHFSNLEAIRIVEVLGKLEEVGDLVLETLATTDLSQVAFVDWYCTDTQINMQLNEIGFQETYLHQGFTIPNRLSPFEKDESPIRMAARSVQPLSPWIFRFDDVGLYVTKSDNDMDRPN